MSEPVHNGGPAFPVPDGEASDRGVRGMSLRDWFACQAKEPDIAEYQEFKANDRPFPTIAFAKYTRVQARYRFADAMLKARGEGR